ncbi:MAG: ABC transporter ATP-binding protein [Lachnospiraceae bacterium]|nr:ABC transporter ATP-binding protein [Lachnospiraceae bacterium]
MSEKDVLLSIEDLVVEYSSDSEIVHAVNDVSLQISKGQTLGLVGETGAGKTTIAKAIMQILPDPPARITGGKVIMDGENLLDLKEDKMQKIRGNRISMIFQDPMTALNPTIVVGKQIMEAISLHEKVSSREACRKAEEMLEKVGIPKERYSDYPHQFSGGMKQRVIIAIALACNPELLLADEPTTALDVTIQAQVLDMMNELKQEFGTSVLMITHDLGIVAETCDCVAVIYAGEIVEYGTAAEIFDNPLHPYTTGLFGSLPNMAKEGGRLKPIDGMMPDPTELPEGCKFAPRCRFATEKCRQGRPELRGAGGSHVVRCMRTS